MDTLEVVLPALAGLVRDAAGRMSRSCGARPREGFTLATEVADWLARNGVPFAEAHEITGALVRYCEERGIELCELTAPDLKAIDPRLDAGHPAPTSTPEAAVAARSGHGGTAPAQVARQLERLRADHGSATRLGRGLPGPERLIARGQDA